MIGQLVGQTRTLIPWVVIFIKIKMRTPLTQQSYVEKVDPSREVIHMATIWGLWFSSEHKQRYTCFHSSSGVL